MSEANSDIVNDHIPNISDQLIDFLCQDPSISEQPRKRRKTKLGLHITEKPEACKNEKNYIIVNRSFLEVKCQKSRLENRLLPLKRYNISPYVQWAHSTEPKHIEIRDQFRHPIFHTNVPETKDRSDIFIALLVDKCKSRAARTHNHLWTEFDIGLTRDSDFDVVQFTFTIKWDITISPSEITSNENRSLALVKVLDMYFPDPRTIVESSWTPQDFYSNAYSPPKDYPYSESIVIPGIKCTLYPFQKRAIQWLLRREGVEWANGSIRDFIYTSKIIELESFFETEDFNGKKFYVSHLFGIATFGIEPFRAFGQSIKGGILSEEMGLGKTIEMISLIALHKLLKISSSPVFDPFSDTFIQKTSATLIITPPAILHQWITEVKQHAPFLKIIQYEGIKTHPKIDFSQLLNKLALSDIVVTTYSVLAAEFHYTQLNPEKKLRREPKYQRPKSPLMMLYWWRCVIDEAQLVESGVSNAAIIARMIPRVNAWCVSGTPVKKDINDIRGLLIFLRYEPYASAKHVWKTLITSHKHEFSKIIRRIAIRHSKQSVRDELKLPFQRRFVITMSFTLVEEQNYLELFKEMCNEVGLDDKGRPLNKGWEIENYCEIMRRWLCRLRQTVLHPQIGSKNRKALGHRDGSLRTIDQVLDAMIDQNQASIKTDQRKMCLLKLKRGQYFENIHRITESLSVWTETAKEASIIVQECREDLKQELIRIKNETRSTVPSCNQVLENNLNIDEEQRDLDSTSRLSTLRNRLRGALEVEHVAEFFIAGAYFQIKSNKQTTRPDSPEFQKLEMLEKRGYETAKELRKEILREITYKANQLMKRVAEKAQFGTWTEIPEFSMGSFEKKMENQNYHDSLSEIARALDSQAIVLKEWRETTIETLLHSLVDEDSGKENTGNEYDDSTKVQEEVMVFVQALRIAICDRHDVLTGQTNNLIRDEVKTAIRLAKNGQGVFPEKTLMLLGLREQIKPKTKSSVRGLINEIRSKFNSLKQDAANGSLRAQKEILVVEKQLKDIQNQMSDQLKVTAALEKEVELFTVVMNTRVEYYRQLQQISDMVSIYDGPTDEKTLVRMLGDERNLIEKIDTSKSKQRYLCHLRQEVNNPSEQKICVICKEKIDIGTITICGHQFCKECISLWWLSHRNCPVCKRRLAQVDLYKIICPHKISIKVDNNIEEQSLQSESFSSPSSEKSAIYTNICQSKFTEIKNIKLDGPSFSTKIATLARHLIWLRDSDPGAKTIIFSQFKEFLNALTVALEQFNIGYSDIDRANGIEKFKHDPNIECFLLHARAHSSGLNLVNASHVILCEPTINTALELQAIARVDRIGQHQETNVWLYIVNDTVEKSIHQLSVRRRMEHLDQSIIAESNSEHKYVDIEKKIEEANSIQLNQTCYINLLAKGGISGEEVASSDLWECLFGNRQRIKLGIS
ncbi:putative ATP-dependent helicase [Erysiphe neolycopersici]|uniref:Putative ATP-dependent helicase n=1 Tax=Erysiphe neolycopersici TaxID=212602 RepID=A0A420HH40_9PEZI|nr:putative ATP-dependent helicase [Erysiphe neolycopersici]